MLKRNTMNKNIALIIAAAVIVGQIPVSVLAENNTLAIGEGVEAVEASGVDEAEVYVEDYAYNQDYNDFSSTSWTKFSGDGTIAKNYDAGELEIKRSGNAKLIFVEDQSPSLKNFEAEVRFQLNPQDGEAVGRFGLVFRGTSLNSHGFIGYNGGQEPGKWLIESPDAWNDQIQGPVLEAGQWVTMKVKVIDSTVILTVNGEEIYNDVVSLNGFPTTAGQFGYRTWYDNKDIKVDYLKIKSLDETGTEISSVEEINVETIAQSRPELPYKVNVTYPDGTTGEEIVIWDYINPESYAQAGSFVVEGTIKGASATSPKAKANITVRDKATYSTDFETAETSGDWEVLQGGGTPTISGGNIKVPMNGVSVAADMACPDVKNFVYETDFTTSTNDGRIGLAFRVKDKDNWGAVCYDAGNWVWKSAIGGAGSWGSFTGSKKLEANITYRMKLEVKDAKMTLSIDGEVIGSATSDKIPTEAGKIGLAGWFGNKTVTLDDVFVEELVDTNGEQTAGDIQTIESDVMTVKLDSKFPRVVEYNWKSDDSTLVGQEDIYNYVNINGKDYEPVVESVVADNKATYTMTIDEIGVTLTTVMSVEDNKVRIEITDIEENSNFVVKKVSLPKHSFASVRDDNGGAIAGVLSTGAWHQITDEMANVSDIQPSEKAKTYAFINDNDFAITMNNNVIEYSSRILLNTVNRNGYKSTGMGTGTWTYREEIENGVGYYSYEDNLWAEAYITKDMNDDNSVDWQDAAIEYRNKVEAPMGGEYIKDSLSYIAFNIGYTQSPFLRTLDTVKKIYNYTDGFGQMVLEKGYQGEGHDDVIPDYGGHIGIRQGGVEDFNTLIEEGAKYNARFGVHVNATEYQKDAFEYPEEIVNENAPGWGWLDQSYYVNQRADITTGELFRRLDMLKDDVPNLGWVYVDVYTGNGWNAHQLGEKLNDLDFQVATEFHSPLEEHVTWTHWGADPAYPNQGGTSEILRFVRNSTKDGFLSNSLLKGNKHLLANGWGNQHALEGTNGMDTFYNQVLPTKYMQHFDIMKMTDDEVLFNEDLRAVREGADINYYKDGKLVATTPESTIGSTGMGKTNLFLEWNFDEEQDTKIYHWNPFGTISTWDVPDSWSGLSNVHVYELTDLGRVEVGTVDIVDGKVTLDVEQNTPYIITQGEVAQDRIDDWGYGSLIKDPGFDAQDWSIWNRESSEGNTDHITFVNETVQRRKGNDVVSIADKQGKITQSIEGLVPGRAYSISAWVKNDGGREVTLTTHIGDTTVTNTMDRASQTRQGEGVKYLDDRFARMEVEFTVPAGVTTADISLEALAGNGTVLVDDFRIWEHPGETNKEGYVFYEDFENVDEGITPFFLAPGRGTSNRTHLAERDLLGRQKMTWVLDGRFSLKTNQQSGETGQMIITDSTTFKLEPNKTYELGFIYSLANAAPGYSINVKSVSGGTVLNIPLTATGVASGQNTNINSIAETFTTGDKSDYYLSVDKGSGYQELILDNIYVTEIDNTVTNPVIDKVNLSLSVNELEVGGELPSFIMLVNGLMSNGSKADLSNATIEYVIADEAVAKIMDGKLVGVSEGTTTVIANLTVDGKTVSSNFVNIKVGENEVPPVIEVDKSGLQVIVDKVGTLIESDYTTESWANLTSALEAANNVLASTDATQQDVDTAKNTLEEAIKALEKKPVTPPVDVIKTHLEIAVEMATEVTDAELENIVPAVVNEFKAALEEAKNLLASDTSTQEKVDASFERLSEAMQMLEFKKGDKANLIKLLERIEALDSSKYIASTWDKLAIALEVSNGIVADENAMEAEIVESYETLLKSFLELRLKPNKDALNDLINKAENLDSAKYTVASFRAVERGLEEANRVFANEDATKEEVGKAEANLRTAISSLQSNAGSSNSGNNASSNNSSNNIVSNSNSNKVVSNSSDSGNSSANGKLPQTGGRSAAAVGVFGTILAVVGAVFSRKKK
ncbi:endo-alpha-N-acetylgalactosaminidase family protein [Clostridium celatum]|uniref:endo-alpha-N-acetylgalactosaminidase family protein n=4 Tax=Clostridium celatum TaxID=36834 RepID=UPI001F1DD2B9|nr:endo-alpha-N-acetylgalactosaminidase family protein [Clostridium celatum]MCE9655075.1 endo-alpha-N-acetylgalactosaminidase family protein [Clostridium celatum]